MNDSNAEFLSKSKLTSLREKWSEPDSVEGKTWDFDGVARSPEHWMGYNHEMREGLDMFGSKTFDELIDRLNTKLNRKPNVLDLMGGAYFLNMPEKTESLIGIRIHNKDEDFLKVHNDVNDVFSRLLDKITKSPNRKIIEADILSNNGWKTIQKENFALADLLVCRPVGPFDIKHSMGDRFDSPKVYAGLYASLFKRMLSLVNKKDGVIFTETPDVYSDDEIKNFFTEIDNKKGSQTTLFTVPDKDYQWGGAKRRYAVIQFKN